MSIADYSGQRTESKVFPPQSLFILRQSYFLGLTNFIAHVVALLAFFAAWNFAKRTKLLLQYVTLRQSPLSIVRWPWSAAKKSTDGDASMPSRSTSTLPPSTQRESQEAKANRYKRRKTYFHMSLLAILIGISFVAGQSDIFINSTVSYGMYVFGVDSIKDSTYSQVLYNGSELVANVTLSRVVLAVHILGDGGSGNGPQVPDAPYRKTYQLYCSASCSMIDCLSSMYFNILLNQDDIAFRGLIPNPGFPPQINSDGSVLSYSMNNISFQSQKRIGSLAFATPIFSGRNENLNAISLMLQMVVKNGTYGNVYFSMPFITERKPFPVDIVYYDYVANSQSGMGFVKYAILKNDWEQLSPLDPTIAPLNSCLQLSDNSGNAVYACFLGSNGVIDKNFDVIQMLVLANSSQSALEGTMGDQLSYSNPVSMNVTASLENGTITFIAGENNTVDVNTIPKLGFNLSFAIRVMNVMSPFEGKQIGPGVNVGAFTGLPQQLSMPVEDCTGNDNIYLFRGADGLHASFGAQFALVWTWHVVAFSLSIFFFLVMLRYNDFNRTILQILAQNPDLTIVGWKKNILDKNSGAPKLLILQKLDNGQKENTEATVSDLPSAQDARINKQEGQLQAANIDDVRDMLVATRKEALPTDELNAMSAKGSISAVVVAQSEGARQVQVITLSQLQQLLAQPVATAESTRKESIEEESDSIVQIGQLKIHDFIHSPANSPTPKAHGSAKFKELQEFWESRKDEDDILDAYDRS